MENEKRLIEYFVIKEKNTGLYFRGKGANRWGKYYNQASIYRMKGQAENTANWLRQCGEPVFDNNLAQVDFMYSAPDAFWVECKDCFAMSGSYNTEEEAIEAWNRRYTPSEIDFDYEAEDE